MKTQTCCFTVHRVIPVDEYEAIAQRLEEEIVNLIHQGVRYFATGGALGFDTMAALSKWISYSFPSISVMFSQYRLGIWVIRQRGFSRPSMATVS